MEQTSTDLHLVVMRCWLDDLPIRAESNFESALKYARHTKPTSGRHVRKLFHIDDAVTAAGVGIVSFRDGRPVAMKLVKEWR